MVQMQQRWRPAGPRTDLDGAIRLPHSWRQVAFSVYVRETLMGVQGA